MHTKVEVVLIVTMANSEDFGESCVVNDNFSYLG